MKAPTDEAPYISRAAQSCSIACRVEESSTASKADMSADIAFVRFVPIPEVSRRRQLSLFQQLSRTSIDPQFALTFQPHDTIAEGVSIGLMTAGSAHIVALCNAICLYRAACQKYAQH